MSKGGSKKERPAAAVRTHNRNFWEARWGQADSSVAPWMNRPIPAELAAAVEEGWFNPGNSALDIGRGQGEVAAWLAEHGFDTLGVDISQEAIDRANAAYHSPPSSQRHKLSFLAADICEAPVPDGPYAVLVDRGCFHQLPESEHLTYGRHIAAVSTSNAHLMLIVRAYRNGESLEDPNVLAKHRSIIERAMGPHNFRIVREELTYLDHYAGKQPEKAEPMPGLCFWLERGREGNDS